MTASEGQVVLVRDASLALQGRLFASERARGVVVFIDATADCQVQNDMLNASGLASLDIGLLTPAERADARAAAYCRNCIELLAKRIVGATEWLYDTPQTRELPIGYFGTGIGSAAALVAAAELPALVSAVVSSDGRPFLARPALSRVRAPTLLIAFSSDSPMLQLNRAALSHLRCEKSLELVGDGPDQSQTSESVSRLARTWFELHVTVREGATG